ncbi:alpha-mannosidase [Amnibacterium setariae]|uniref:Alpha-mannosidase n=1 Tax=Amnibacterium setariae TaxID=2306585 RepID=A0A3A1U742_9MICO|nr:alpha-mannosidase [Amnibacterium setariae]
MPRAVDRVRRILEERVGPAVVRAAAPVEVSAWHAPGEPVPFAEAVRAEYAPFAVGTPWGAPWSTTWFRLRGAAPAAPAPGLRAELLVDLGFSAGAPGFQAEGLLYTPDGVPVEGLAPRRHSVPGAIAADGSVDVLLEAAANPDVLRDLSFAPTPLGERATAGLEPLYVLRRADVVLVDLEVRGLEADLVVLAELASALPEDSTRRARILVALDAACAALDLDDVAGTAARARAVLAPALASPAVPSAQAITAVGHAHIDSAWLWPIRETRRKVARTIANVLALMDEDPGFVYAMSSAQQYAWLEEDQPALFARLAERVREGRFVPVGGMWVESDTNLPGGEALARQFVAGTRWFRDRFGVDGEGVWLPDSFGYTAALPQIARLAGKRWLLTQKASWNDTNRIPHHTFSWEGLDGTRLFTHFPPVDTYNADGSVPELLHSERNFADAAVATRALLPFGHGDGGGGPTREMLLRLARARSLEGVPTVEIGTPQAFYRAAEEELTEPAVWAGELYLELHRGTYTSQRRTKQGNRRNEHLLREAELWAATAAIRVAAPYPAVALERLWRHVLLLQFHDILPGSAIAWVHREAVADHAAITAELEALIASSLAALAGEGDALLLANAAPDPRRGVAALGVGAPTPPRSGAVTADGSGFVLEDEAVRAVVDAEGMLVSLVHRASGRETVPPGTRGNRFQLHEDHPVRWDAWDVDREYRATAVDLDGPAEVRADGDAVVVVRRFGRSSLEQRLRLVPGGELRIETTVDWQEREKLLKLAFPVDVRAERVASEVQFGHVERATHANTSWDAARFETSQHRWQHLGEPGFGVAVVNDSVYGSDTTRIRREGGGTASLLRLSILRAARFPDPEQDRGAHRFAVGLLPGARVVDAVAAGYRINLLERTVRGGGAVEPLLAVEGEGVVVESVKLAEDGDGDIVVRLYEALGRSTEAAVVLGVAHEGVEEVDLLEDPLAPSALVGVDGGRARLRLRPFRIVTLRVRRPHGRRA